MDEVKRYTASVMHPGVREDPQGLLVAYRDYDRLKAALLGSKHINNHLKQELEETKRERDQLAGIGIQCGCGEASCTTDADNLHQALCEIRRLKAEVELLELEVFAFDRTIKQASCHYDNRLEDIRQLQAQVERMTKAGDAMASILQFEERLYHDDAQDPECVKVWNTAKEGKQSNG
jgi:hypothetical protein